MQLTHTVEIPRRFYMFIIRNSVVTELKTIETLKVYFIHLFIHENVKFYTKKGKKNKCFVR